MSSHRNRTGLKHGRIQRITDTANPSGGKSRHRLLPCLASRPAADRRVDPERLARELTTLAEMGRRAGSG